MLQNDYAGHYAKLYTLQDKILNIIFSFDNLFYLTGGTALTRFHKYNHRYSDDLDFFTNKNNLFKAEFREFKELIEEQNIIFNIAVESKDFIRIIFKEEKFKQEKLELQVDFVNDYVKRSEKADIIDSYKIDTINEIISNKFGAILNRDEPKDIADIVEAYRQGYKDWIKAFEMALLKQQFSVEDLILRLETFPVKLLEKIRYVDSSIKYMHLTNCKSILSSITNLIAG